MCASRRRSACGYKFFSVPDCLQQWVPALGHVEIQKISLGLPLGLASESSVVGKEHVQLEGSESAFVENGFVPE